MHISNQSIESFVDNLKSALQHNLPGADAQNIMSPIEDSIKYRQVPKEHKVASVMALLHPKQSELFLTLIKRASHPKDKHAGQLGFPGGKMELEDESFLECALRETEEEIGIQRNKIEVLGNLTPLYVFASNFNVYPYVGFTSEVPEYVVQESEVSSVIEVSIEKIFHPNNKIYKPVKLSIGADMEVAGYNVNNHFLWGATAMITSELEAIFSIIS